MLVASGVLDIKSASTDYLIKFRREKIGRGDCYSLSFALASDYHWLGGCPNVTSIFGHVTYRFLNSH